jgi:hypothetical protein
MFGSKRIIVRDMTLALRVQRIGATEITRKLRIGRAISLSSYESAPA